MDPNHSDIDFTEEALMLLQIIGDSQVQKHESSFDSTRLSMYARAIYETVQEASEHPANLPEQQQSPEFHEVNSNSDSSSSNSDSSSAKSMKSELTLEELRPLFSRTLKEAAAHLGRSPSYVKKRLRFLNIQRWPCRKLVSLSNMRRCCQLVGSLVDSEIRESFLELVSKNEERIVEDPNAPIEEYFDKLRQSQYKLHSSRKTNKKRKTVFGRLY
jgi:hypothetical protein